MDYGGPLPHIEKEWKAPDLSAPPPKLPPRVRGQLVTLLPSPCCFPRLRAPILAVLKLLHHGREDRAAPTTEELERRPWQRRRMRRLLRPVVSMNASRGAIGARICGRPGSPPAPSSTVGHGDVRE
jgi:hypothetical protein